MERSRSVLRSVVALTAILSLLACRRQRIQVLFDLQETLDQATVVSPQPHLVAVRMGRVADQERPVIFAPPKTQLQYEILVPQKARLEFGCAAAPRCWEVRGDGVLFEVLVTTGSGSEVIVHSRYVDAKNNTEARKWFDERVNLTAFEGQRVTVTLATKPGPADDIWCDDAFWSRPRLLGLPR